MSVTDPIADMLTRVRNAQAALHDEVEMPASKMRVEIARILKEQGYALDYDVQGEPPRRVLRIQLKYLDARKRACAITGLKRVSRPSLRTYTGATDIPRVLGGFGCAILSTPRGILTGEQARRARVGGEVLCYVW
jgi:small subunit ribosomal protein S8